MSTAPPENNHELELFAGLVLGDLTDEEREHVETVLVDERSKDTLFRLERTAAAVQLSLHQTEIGLQGTGSSMPVHVAERIRSAAHEIVSEKSSTSKRDSNQSVTLSTASELTTRESMAWLCAAAALLFAVGLWLSDATPKSQTAADARLALIGQASDVIRVEWSAGKTPFDNDVSGDVVWHPSSQTGFMRFVNMPVNDPSVEQYQLWIIDPKRDDEPVDGGVFDVTESGEVVVPIDAKLNVVQPAAFAITIEQPGGVVVSTQERLPLLAAVE